MKHRTHQQWQELFKQHATSGLSVAVFCKEHGIGQSYFYKRKSDLIDNETNITKKFIKVKPPQKNNPTTPLIKIQHQQTQLHFPSSISAIWLADFVKALA